MSNRVCFECARQEPEKYMYQVEVKNKTNDRVKWKWTCYPCQGRRHPVETERLALEVLDRRAAVAVQEQEEKELKKIAEAWNRLYQKELAVAEDQLSVKLASPFDNFDFSDVKADDKRAYKEFKEEVSQYDKEQVAGLFEAIGGFEFDESKPLLTEEFMYEAIEAVEEYHKPGFTIGLLLTFTLPAYLSYLMWEEFLWWESLGAGAVSWILLVVIWSRLFTKKFPADFNFAINRLKESADAWSEGLTEMHETVLQNTIVELIKSNKTAEERLQARYGSTDKLERMSYDKEESESGALKEKAKE